jgi:hypothetical protein
MCYQSNYQLSNQESLDRFRNAKREERLAEAIEKKNVLGDEMVYWYGVLLARLEGMIPPFRPGDEVVVKSGCGLVSSPAPDGPTIPDDDSCVYEVDRVWYYGGTWFLEFALMGTPECRPYYVAEFFEMASN